MTPRVRSLAKYKTPQREYASMDALIEAEPQRGISTIALGKAYFDVNYTPRNSDVLVVHLGAALSAKVETVPSFGGVHLLADVEVDLLSIADPNTSLRQWHATGWYAGTRNFPTQHWAPKVASHYAQGRPIVYFGSSAGGYAALTLSALTPNASGVAVNPRTELFTMPSKFPEYSKVSFPGYSEQRIRSSIHTNAADLYQHPGTPLWYIQNTQDSVYWNDHYLPFRKATSSNSDISYVLGEWGNGHVIPPRQVLIDTLKTAVRASS